LTLVRFYAVYDDGKIIFPYQDGAGSIKVDVYDVETFDKLAEHTVGSDPIPGDQHGEPAIIKYGDYYVLCYGAHSYTGQLKVAYSKNLSEWTVYDFPDSGNFAYPQFFVKDGKLYLVIRHSASATHTLNRLYRCDDLEGKSWTLIATLVDDGDGYSPYVHLNVTEEGRVILVWGRYRYDTDDYDTIICVAYSDDLSKWYNADGVEQSLPLTSGNCQLHDFSPNKVSGGIPNGEGDDIVLSVHIKEPESKFITVIRKTIGGSKTVVQSTDNGSSDGVSVHGGTVRVFCNYYDGAEWKPRIYRLEGDSLIPELELPYSGTRAGPAKSISGLYDSAVFSIPKDSLDSNVNDVAFVVSEEALAEVTAPTGWEWMQTLMDLMNSLMYLVLFILVLSLLISSMREAKRPAEE